MFRPWKRHAWTVTVKWTCNSVVDAQRSALVLLFGANFCLSVCLSASVLADVSKMCCDSARALGVLAGVSKMRCDTTPVKV